MLNPEFFDVKKYVDHLIFSNIVDIKRAIDRIRTVRVSGRCYVHYIYPKWHTVSFTLVARKHIQYMKAVAERFIECNINEIDERAFIGFSPTVPIPTFVHPAFYIMSEMMQKRFKKTGVFDKRGYEWWRKKFDRLIAVEVADSDRLSDQAVEIANMFDVIVVPSTFSRDAFVNSGVKRPVRVAPHGLDFEWYLLPNFWHSSLNYMVGQNIWELYQYKQKTGKKLILFWLWHSAGRKGWPEVKRFYEKLRRRRDDVILVLKTYGPNPPELEEVRHLGAINIYGWISEYEKMALFDLAEITLNFSRGGAFELNCLEALGRGKPCLAHRCCGWADYVPDFIAVKKGERVQPLPGNHIHVGYGYTVDVDDAVDKAEQILDNYDEYLAKLEEYKQRVLMSKFNWYVPAIELIKSMG